MFVSVLDLAAIFLALIAVFGWLNLRFLRLPTTVGLMLIGLIGATVALATDRLVPGFGLDGLLTGLLTHVDFAQAVLRFMLSFLLFAAGMKLDIGAARASAWTAAVLASVGVVVSTIAIGFGFWALAQLFAVKLSLAWALVFGALISPTDPVAVLASMKYAPLPLQVRALVQAESLFNDGVGIALFGALLTMATGGSVGGWEVVGEVGVAAGGAALLGAGAALICLRALAEIDDHGVETAITLALATGVYALAERFGVSGPIAAAVAGIVVGSDPARRAMSENTHRYVRGFWNLMDEILNATLFLLIGLEVLIVHFELDYAPLAAGAVVLVLVARLVSITPPAVALARSREKIGYWIVPLLTWAGVRGGISIALALSLHARPEKTLIVMATYAVVLFSVFVQSLSTPRLLRWLELEVRERAVEQGERP